MHQPGNLPHFEDIVSKLVAPLQKSGIEERKPDSNKAVKVLQYSPGRSGSTMLYQVLSHLGTDVYKTHEWVDVDSKVVITYRHPCDLFCSFFRISRDLDGDDDLQSVMRQGWNPTVWWTISRGLRYVRKGYGRLQRYLDSDKEICLLRYERFKDDYEYLFNSLASFLSLSIDRATRDRVECATSFSKNKILAASYTSFKEFDQKTLLHGKHLGSGTAGQWHYVCPVWMCRFLEKKLARELALYQDLADRDDAVLPMQQRESEHPPFAQVIPLGRAA